MQEKYQNKQMTPDPAGATDEQEEFHFSGGGEFEPMTIIAHSQSEAHRLWVQKRKPVGNQPINKQEEGQ